MIYLLAIREAGAHSYDTKSQPNIFKKMQGQKRFENVGVVFQLSWSGYKTCAWLEDELAAPFGGDRSTFEGWAAMLSTHWIRSRYWDCGMILKMWFELSGR